MSKLYLKKDKNRKLTPEPFHRLDVEPYREEFRRDYSRLLHSPAFRRLQGKTQLYPGIESDFFRNRLTHSLEVAQIAKSIAIRINNLYSNDGKLLSNKKGNFGVNLDLVEFAGLAHDLGHPPFGHQGEEALDQCMRDMGGFEGNAQTIRILTRLEKKFELKDNCVFDNGKDVRLGLNLCSRSICSVLKYDSEIPIKSEDRDAKSIGSNKPMKGFYSCDSNIIEDAKNDVLLGYDLKGKKFKTLECYIMDIADDVAYSIFDLEDGFKAGFITPLDLLYPKKELLDKITEKVNDNLKKENVKIVLSNIEIINKIKSYFFDVRIPEEDIKQMTPEEIEVNLRQIVDASFSETYFTSQNVAKSGSFRTPFTSTIVGRFIRGVELDYNKNRPAISIARLNDETRILVEILKTFTYLSQIDSPRLRIAEYRGKEIVTKIFTTLDEDGGYRLLPDDIREIYHQSNGSYKTRIICDYVASMTDKYAIEFYGRLTSENPETIFKEH